MKKSLAFCLIFVTAVSLIACGQADETADTPESVQTDTGPSETVAGSTEVETDSELSSESKEEKEMIIQVTDGTHTVTFALNNSPAAKSLYDQLPLTTDVENYSDNEKIFYPKKLDTSKAVDANAKKGTLAYFSPWGDVVMYYKDFGSYSGLYELGQAVSGSDEIESLSGTIDVTVVE